MRAEIKIIICIVLLVIGPVFSGSYTASANMDGDEDDLLLENKVFLNLTDVPTHNGYLIENVHGPASLFDGDESTILRGGQGKWEPFYLYFPIPVKVVMVRYYNVSGIQGQAVSCGLSLFTGYRTSEDPNPSGEGMRIFECKTGSGEEVLPGIVVPIWTIMLYHNGAYDVQVGELEFYIDPTYQPFLATTNTTYNNVTYRNNTYYNTTYQNDTYLNETYLNETFMDYRNITYLNKTYQNDTYTGTYTDVTYRNVTYQNFTNQTGGAIYQNITKEFVNYTYLNETVLQDNKRLEDKLNNVMDRLNETEGSSIKDAKSEQETYIEPILIVLIIIVIILQVLILVFRKRKETKEKVDSGPPKRQVKVEAPPQMQTNYQPPPVSPPVYQQVPTIPQMPQVPTLKPAPASVQSIIPGFTLTHKIGAGGFATVYKGRDAKGSTVAIKLPKIMDRGLIIRESRK